MHSTPRFFLTQGLILTLSFILLLLIFPVGGALDQSIIQPWVGVHGTFPLRNDWSLAVLNHRYIKNILIAVYVFYLVAWVGSFKVPSLKAQRFELGYFFFVAILSTAVIGLIKSQSAHACPWNMNVPTAESFIWNFSAIHGHCFPGGHASTGFALMTGFFAYRISNPRRAYFFLIAGLIIGFGFGWAQMMRGAHFLSHNLWTAWIIWALNTAFYFCAYRYFPKTTVPKRNEHKRFEWI